VATPSRLPGDIPGVTANPDNPYEGKYPIDVLSACERLSLTNPDDASRTDTVLTMHLLTSDDASSEPYGQTRQVHMLFVIAAALSVDLELLIANQAENYGQPWVRRWEACKAQRRSGAPGANNARPSLRLSAASND
jgi:hypothetical protein